MHLAVPNGLQIGYLKRAVASVEEDLTFSPGEITLLLGLNGAGKTTLMKTVSGLLPPVQGMLSNARALYLSEDVDFPPNLTPREIASCLAAGRQERGEAADRLHALQVEEQPYGKLSKGNRHKARLVFAHLTALSRRVELVSLDEPFSGLDFISREHLIHDWFNRGENASWHLLVSVHPSEIPFIPHQMIVVARGEVRTIPTWTPWPEVRNLLTANIDLRPALA